jgi:hypothetical protein
MASKGQNLGGRAYLKAKLGEIGVSRRLAVRILNEVFEGMSQALARGECVESPFGYLIAVPRWEVWGPRRPNRIEHSIDGAGQHLLEGRELSAWTPGWSLQPDKDSLSYLFDKAGKRNRKKTGQPARGGAKRELVNNSLKTGK